MNSELKNIILGIMIGGVTVAGGYALFDNNSVGSETLNSGYTRTDNQKETRSILSTGGADKDCSDFSTHIEAQLFFEANGGPASDLHNLDRNGDGQACESLP